MERIILQNNKVIFSYTVVSIFALSIGVSVIVLMEQVNNLLNIYNDSEIDLTPMIILYGINFIIPGLVMFLISIISIATKRKIDSEKRGDILNDTYYRKREIRKYFTKRYSSSHK